MPVSTTFNGTTYNIPATGETGWGTTVTNFLTDVGNNALCLTGTQTASNKLITLQNGSAGTPSLSFTADTASGLYQPLSGEVALSAGGVQRLLVDTSGVINVLGAPGQINASAGDLKLSSTSGAVRAPTMALSDSSTAVATTAFVQTVPAAVGNTGRNFIHNPLFNIVQRGVGAFTSNGVYTLDRWVINLTGDSDSVIQLALSDGDRAAIGDEAVEFGLSNTFTGVAGASNFSLLVHRIEDVKRLSNKTVTVSFWAKIAVGTTKLGVSIDQAFGSGGSGSVLGTGQTVNLTTTWTRFNLQFVLGSASGKTIGAGSYTQLDFWYSAGSTFNTRSGSIGTQGTAATVTLWGVQLEIGSVATQLEKPDPRYDLSNCQRFYQAYTGAIAVGYNSWATGGFFDGQATYPTQMRATPTTVTLGSTSSPTNFASTQVLNNSAMGFQYQVTSTSSGATAVTIAGYTATADL